MTPRCAAFEQQPSGRRVSLRRCTLAHGHDVAHVYGSWYLPGRDPVPPVVSRPCLDCKPGCDRWLPCECSCHEPELGEL